MLSKITKIVTAGKKTIAVRIPKHNVARKLLSILKVPLAAPSANISSKLSPVCAQDVLDELYGVVGVAKKKFYDINVPYEEQILEDKAAQRDRDAAIVAAREMAARAESQENV